MHRLIPTLLVILAGLAVRAAEPPAPLMPVPSPQQLRWQRAEMAELLRHDPQARTDGADKAVDDDPETRWATADEVRQCWLEVDLRQPQTIDRTTIAELEPRITQFQFEYRLTPGRSMENCHVG